MIQMTNTIVSLEISFTNNKINHRQRGRVEIEFLDVGYTLPNTLVLQTVQLLLFVYYINI